MSEARQRPLIRIACETVARRAGYSDDVPECDHRYAAAVKDAGGHPVLPPVAHGAAVRDRSLEGTRAVEEGVDLVINLTAGLDARLEPSAGLAPLVGAGGAREEGRMKICAGFRRRAAGDRLDPPSRLNSRFSILLLLLSACSSPPPPEPPAAVPPAPITGTQLEGYVRTYELAGPLVPASTTMASAWDIPANPLTDEELGASPEADLVRRGYRLFTDTPGEAARFTHDGLSCGNCHLNAGQRELALPLVGVDAMFPEYNKRAGRDFTLEDRIVGCFMRSENATGGTETPEPDAPEVTALAAYLRWLSRGYPKGENPPWRKKNTISADRLIPVDQLDPVKGEAIYREKCQSCHGIEGQGVQIGDKKAGPLWGPGSWNDGAGAARTYTLAGIVRYAMPYLAPGSLTDEEAQHVAAFITSKPRPVYPFKDQDYLKEPMPVDAVYYKRQRP